MSHPPSTRNLTAKECVDEIAVLVETFSITSEQEEMLPLEPHSRLRVLRKVCSMKGLTIAEVLSYRVH